MRCSRRLRRTHTCQRPRCPRGAAAMPNTSFGYDKAQAWCLFRRKCGQRRRSGRFTDQGLRHGASPGRARPARLRPNKRKSCVASSHMAALRRVAALLRPMPRPRARQRTECACCPMQGRPRASPPARTAPRPFQRREARPALALRPLPPTPLPPRTRPRPVSHPRACSRAAPHLAALPTAQRSGAGQGTSHPAASPGRGPRRDGSRVGTARGGRSPRLARGSGARSPRR